MTTDEQSTITIGASNQEVEDLYKLKWRVECSQRYHAHRRSFFDGLHMKTMLGVLITGSAVFSNIVGYLEWFGAAAALLAATDMVIRYSHKARDHEMLYRRFNGVATEIARKGATETNRDQLNNWDARIEEIFGDEPPVYRALHAICHNEVVIAHNRDPENLIDLKLRHHILFNFWRFRNFGLRTRGQMEQDSASGFASSAAPTTA